MPEQDESTSKINSKKFISYITWASPAKTFWRGPCVSTERDKAPLSGARSCYKGDARCQIIGNLTAPLITLSLVYPIPRLRSNETDPGPKPARPKRPAERLPARRWCRSQTPRTGPDNSPRSGQFPKGRWQVPTIGEKLVAHGTYQETDTTFGA